MGIFDEVEIACPYCGSVNLVQSKADTEAYLNHYTLQNAPVCILMDIDGDEVECTNCKKMFEISTCWNEKSLKRIVAEHDELTWRIKSAEKILVDGIKHTHPIGDSRIIINKALQALRGIREES